MWLGRVSRRNTSGTCGFTASSDGYCTLFQFEEGELGKGLLHVCLIVERMVWDAYRNSISPQSIILMDQLAPEEVDDEVEVAFDEEYDPEREEQLKNQLANQKGTLSPYWARTFTC